jgi:hypothetical protein
MPLGQRPAYMAPEGRLRIRDLHGERVVGPRDSLREVKAGKGCHCS